MARSRPSLSGGKSSSASSSARRYASPSSVRSSSSSLGRRRQIRLWIRRLAIVSVALLALQYFLAGSSPHLRALATDGDDDDGEALGRAWRPRRVLLLTAHPDDEVMFFAPAVQALVGAGVGVHGLCLSNGDADGLGVRREAELNAAYARLGVGRRSRRSNKEADAVTLLHDDALQDGMQREWDTQTIAHHVVRHAHSHGPYDAILTFDKHGVSQHANHLACYEAARKVANAHTLQRTSMYAVRTLTPAGKFLGLPGALVRHAVTRARHAFLPAALRSARRTPGLLQPSSPASLPPDTLAFLSSPVDYVRALRAMTEHRTQLVWFRYLYLFFSSYMYGVQLDIIV